MLKVACALQAAPGTVELEPAFEMKLIQDPSGRQLGVIQWHPDVHKGLRDAIEFRALTNPTHQPMVVRMTWLGP